MDCDLDYYKKVKERFKKSEVLKLYNKEGWINGINSKFNNTIRNISMDDRDIKNFDVDYDENKEFK